MTDLPGQSTTRWLTLIDVLERQANAAPLRPAYSFWAESGEMTTWSFAELAQRSRAIAAQLQQQPADNPCVMLVFPAGLDFISAFFGCLYAGRVPVPATYPKPRRPMPRLSSIAKDCGAPLALTTSSTLQVLEQARAAPELANVQWSTTDEIALTLGEQWQRPQVGAEDLALLQYTSGSTTEPKGVMVSHANLLHNLEVIRQGFNLGPGSEEEAGVFWLPAYHDMGLIGGILEPLYVGGHSILMPPHAFLLRPLRWLQLISEHRAVVSGGPNFAYDLCVRKVEPEQLRQLDLSSWQVAFCGAEPIHAATMQRFAETFAPAGFRADAFYPCYGLAEATLLAAGSRGPGPLVVRSVDRTRLAENQLVPARAHDASAQQLVGCGHALLDQSLRIVNPDTCRPCAPGEIGEIWLQGSSIAQGYWNRAEETVATFRARIEGEDSGTYLRTGDLGVVYEGQLFVTGRIKDVIIIRGRNYYPQDIERTAEQSHEALSGAAGCAFAVGGESGERLVVVQEVDRQFRGLDHNLLIQAVRRAVATEFEVEVSAVALVRHASLPRTTSGKIQRPLCREQYLAGDLKTIAESKKPEDLLTEKAATPSILAGVNGKRREVSTGATPNDAGGSERPVPKLQPPTIAKPDRPLTAPELDRLTERIEGFLLQWLEIRAGVATSDLDRTRPFAEMGIDSLTAVELSQQLEDWLGVRLTPVVAWNYPTPAALARYLAEQYGGVSESTSEAAAEESVSEFERLLAEIESMSETDAQAALEQKPKED